MPLFFFHPFILYTTSYEIYNYTGVKHTVKVTNDDVSSTTTIIIPNFTEWVWKSRLGCTSKSLFREQAAIKRYCQSHDRHHWLWMLSSLSKNPTVSIAQGGCFWNDYLSVDQFCWWSCSEDTQFALHPVICRGSQWLQKQSQGRHNTFSGNLYDSCSTPQKERNWEMCSM